jgi:peptidoglycan/xylan/chitin deacetylase (PgdA/CDA1 family)
MSKRYLEQITGKEIRSIAFPYGSYSKNVLEESEAAGYTQLLATELMCQGDKNNVLLRERLTINPFISTVNQMHANISGSYD